MIADRRTAAKFAETHLCPNCGQSAVLVVRWSAADSNYQVWCRLCGATEGFIKPESLTAMWRRDPGSVPVTVANRLAAKYGGEAMSETAIVVATERQMTERIGQARWLHELAPEDRTTLAHLAVQYGLDPIMSELVIYESKPYITLAGMIRAAHRQPEFEGIEDRPMTTEERTAYGIKQPIAWLTLVYRRGWRVPVKGIGTADPADPYRSNPIERKNPQIMARSRSIRQALRTGFPHCLPWNEINTAGEDVEAMDAEVREIDMETGEVTRPASNGNGQQEAAASEAQPEQPAEAPTAGPAPEATVQQPNPTHTPERPTTGMIARFSQLWQDAIPLSVDTSDLAIDPQKASREEVVSKGKELAARIEAAKAASGTKQEAAF